MAKLAGRWVAKFVGRWVAKLVGRWVTKLLAHLLATAALRVRIQTSPKNKKNWRHNQRSDQHNPARQKNIQKNNCVLGSVFRHLSVAVLVWISYPEPVTIFGRKKRCNIEVIIFV